MKYRRLVIIGGVTIGFLSVPMIAMQFSDDVNWTVGDFVVAGVLFFGFGLLCELTMRRLGQGNRRILACLTLLVIFLLIWGELAVGIFGSPLGGT